MCDEMESSEVSSCVQAAGRSLKYAITHEVLNLYESAVKKKAGGRRGGGGVAGRGGGCFNCNDVNCLIVQPECILVIFFLLCSSFDSLFSPLFTACC